jgi:hypothetical protein
VRAVVLNSFTGIEGLELTDLPDPTPGEGAELVNVRAASIGPWDLGNADGAFVAMGGSSDFPQVQGWDFAGETVDGRQVLGFVAQPWMGIGTLAEQIVTVNRQRSQYFGPNGLAVNYSAGESSTNLQSDLYWRYVKASGPVQRELSAPRRTARTPRSGTCTAALRRTTTPTLAPASCAILGARASRGCGRSR